MEHSFNTEYAEKYGVNEAILIRNFQFWLLKNREDGRNQREGRTWTYIACADLHESLPYLPINQIKGGLQRLEHRHEVIITGNFNKHPYDKTKWYAFADEATFLDDCVRVKANERRIVTITPEMFPSADVLKSMAYADYLQTSYWRFVRAYVISRSGGVCLKCGATKRLQVHHQNYEHMGEELEHWREDLDVLCKDCHIKHHQTEGDGR